MLRHVKLSKGAKTCIINVRFGKDKLRCSKPCLHCAKALEKYSNMNCGASSPRWDKLGYTTDDGFVLITSKEFSSDEYQHVTSGHRIK